MEKIAFMFALVFSLQISAWSACFRLIYEISTNVHYHGGFNGGTKYHGKCSWKAFWEKLYCRSGAGYWNDPGTIGTAFSGENCMHLLPRHIERFSLSLCSIQVPSGKTALRPQRKRKYGMSQSLEIPLVSPQIIIASCTFLNRGIRAFWETCLCGPVRCFINCCQKIDKLNAEKVTMLCRLIDWLTGIQTATGSVTVFIVWSIDWLIDSFRTSFILRPSEFCP